MRHVLRDIAAFVLFIIILVVLRIVCGEKLWDMLEND